MTKVINNIPNPGSTRTPLSASLTRHIKGEVLHEERHFFFGTRQLLDFSFGTRLLLDFSFGTRLLLDFSFGTRHIHSVLIIKSPVKLHLRNCEFAIRVEVTRPKFPHPSANLPRSPEGNDCDCQTYPHPQNTTIVSPIYTHTHSPAYI